MKTVREESEDEVKTPGTDDTSDGPDPNEINKFGVTDEQPKELSKQQMFEEPTKQQLMAA